VNIIIVCFILRTANDTPATVSPRMQAFENHQFQKEHTVQSPRLSGRAPADLSLLLAWTI
jgi:hypothetical protein